MVVARNRQAVFGSGSNDEHLALQRAPIIQEFGDRLVERIKKKARHAAGSALHAIGEAWQNMASEVSAAAERVEHGPESAERDTERGAE